MDLRVQLQKKMISCWKTSIDELKFVMFSMHPHKSLGPYGYTPEFYKKKTNKWGSLKLYLHYILRDLDQIQKINIVIITLIPKTKQPTKLTNFSPISLCNVIYRLFFLKCLPLDLKNAFTSLSLPFKMFS